MNRLKFILVLIILALTTILWLQNQDTLALNFFCPDTTANESCLYRTPKLTRGTWILLFVLAGAVSNLLSQVLARAGTNQKAVVTRPNQNNNKQFQRREEPSRVSQANTLPTPEPKRKPESTMSDWEKSNSLDWETITTPNQPKSRANDSIPKRRVQSKADSPFTDQKQQNPDVKGATESTKSNRPQTQVNKTKDSDRSNQGEDIYDATYRTVGNPKTNNSIDELQSEDDEQWI